MGSNTAAPPRVNDATLTDNDRRRDSGAFDALAALAASEARYRALVEASSQGIWRRSASGASHPETLAWWENLTGQPPAEGLVWGWLQMLHPDDRERAKHAWTEAFKTRTIFDVEYRILNRAGEYRHYVVRGVPVGNDAEPGDEWIGTFTDVTESRSAEAAALDQERVARTRSEWLQQITATLLPLRTVNEIGAYIAGPFAAQIGASVSWVGRVSDDGTSLETIGIGGVPAGVAQTWQRYPLDMELPICDALRAGEAQWWATRDELIAAYPNYAATLSVLPREGAAMVPLLVGTDAAAQRVGGISFGFTDARALDEDTRVFILTAAQQCAQALERARLADSAATSLALLDGVFADAPVGLAFFDRRFRCVRINGELARLNGLPIDAHLGKRLEEVLPSLASEVNPLFQRVFDTGEAVHGVEYVERSPENGEPRSWRGSYFPVRAGGRHGGEIIAVGVAAEDVTEELRAESDRELLLTLGTVLQRAELSEDPRALATAGLRLLGDHLDVDRMSFATSTLR